jgi:hypothetical protein
MGSSKLAFQFYYRVGSTDTLIVIMSGGQMVVHDESYNYDLLSYLLLLLF